MSVVPPPINDILGGLSPTEAAKPKRSRQLVTLADLLRTPPAARASTGVPPLDDLLDGGLVSGQSVLLTGPPGVGATTLLFHIAGGLRCAVLFASSEEAQADLAERARRLGLKNEQLSFLTDEVNVEEITEVATQSRAAAVIADSLLGLYHAGVEGDIGTTDQICGVSNYLTSLAKSEGVIVLARAQSDVPAAVVHLFDTHLALEDEGNDHPATLRVVKNRLGSDDRPSVDFSVTERGIAWR